MSTDQRLVRNASRRPVELHLADRVEVLLPEAVIELGADELAAACITPLLVSGALTQFDPPPPKPPRKPRKAIKGKAATRTRGPSATSDKTRNQPPPASPTPSANTPSAKSSTPKPAGRTKPSGDST